MVASVPLSTGGNPANRNAISATAAAAATIQSAFLAMVLLLLSKGARGCVAWLLWAFAMVDMTVSTSVEGGSTSGSSLSIRLASSLSRHGSLVSVIVLLASRPANRRVVAALCRAAI